jgi:hypothetical protein
MKMVLSGAEKTEALFGDFQIAGPVIVVLALVLVVVFLTFMSLTVMPLTFVSLTFVFVMTMTVVVFGCCAHTVCSVLRRRTRIIPENR